MKEEPCEICWRAKERRASSRRPKRPREAPHFTLHRARREHWALRAGISTGGWKHAAPLRVIDSARSAFLDAHDPEIFHRMIVPVGDDEIAHPLQANVASIDVRQFDIAWLIRLIREALEPVEQPRPILLGEHCHLFDGALLENVSPSSRSGHGLGRSSLSDPQRFHFLRPLRVPRGTRLHRLLPRRLAHHRAAMEKSHQRFLIFGRKFRNFLFEFGESHGGEDARFLTTWQRPGATTF